jgi:hypothetical protein
VIEESTQSTALTFKMLSYIWRNVILRCSSKSCQIVVGTYNSMINMLPTAKELR